MGRPKKNGQPCKPTVITPKDERREKLEIVIIQRQINDYDLPTICNKIGISVPTLYAWLNEPQHADLKEKFKKAVTIGDFNSNDLILSDAKAAMRELIKGKTVMETTKAYKFEGKKKILVSQYDKEKKIEPSFEVVKFVAEHLSPIYSSTNVKDVMVVFMQFNEFVKQANPALASQLADLQTSFLTLTVKELDTEENNDNPDAKTT